MDNDIGDGPKAAGGKRKRGGGKQKTKGRKKSKNATDKSDGSANLQSVAIELSTSIDSADLDDLDESSSLPLPPAFSMGAISVPLHNNKPLSWGHKVNIIGQKCLDTPIHFCDICKLPIFTYGRLIPCKHVFCHSCAQVCPLLCRKCDNKIVKIERTELGSVYKCEIESCGRTYLSSRDLQAHHNHRHLRKTAAEKSAINARHLTAVMRASAYASNVQTVSLSRGSGSSGLLPIVTNQSFVPSWTAGPGNGGPGNSSSAAASLNWSGLPGHARSSQQPQRRPV